MHLQCCYGVCKSKSRKAEAGVIFIPFPKPRTNPKISKRWVYLCAREGFTMESINRFTYICSKHFPPGEELNIKSNPNLEPFDARNSFEDRLIINSNQMKALNNPEEQFKQKRMSTNPKLNISFNCEKCDYKTQLKFNLKRHIQEVHCMGRIFQCEECDYNVLFKRRMWLLFHFPIDLTATLRYKTRTHICWRKKISADFPTMPLLLRYFS